MSLQEPCTEPAIGPAEAETVRIRIVAMIRIENFVLCIENDHYSQ